MDIKTILPQDASYKGQGCVYRYGFSPSEALGEVFVVCDGDGALVYTGFNTPAGKAPPLDRAMKHLPKAQFVQGDVEIEAAAMMALWRGDDAAELCIALHGTAFQQSVWQDLLHIPFGHTVSYADVAHNIGRPKAMRAVGNAVGANPISLVVPCHRVIQSNGSFTNYGWGNAMKQRVLEAEGAFG